MQLPRPQLTVLLNALHDEGVTEFAVEHPCESVGTLLEVELSSPSESTVRLPKSLDEYAAARSRVESEHGPSVAKELPERRSFACALLAGGVVDPVNQDAIEGFLDRYGNPDLTSGHKPVVAGFDTNLVGWRTADVLDLAPGRDGTVNGFALATGVRDELDWDDKRSDTRELEDAFGGEFDALWNQPAGSRREGRLGETYYRQLRDHRYADEVVTDTGDEAIVRGYEAYQDESRKDVLLFSNDRDFVERARSHRVLAQRVELPRELPRSVEVGWTTVQDTLYVLSVLFGVLTLPKVTLYGVWKGKGGHAWQAETLDLDCRSPAVETLIERDLSILG